ncbi:PQQ-dependent sugar dehydrogenase [Azospirillum halopraeferens]|uniref:PQQ-dependent sugar dehydrogenase n=1 Tax=Azospirillum halopraeferens TaxID=34010 RepID=UPI000411C464|nr:PQQ-dependent sugar dehydrogenase [Azospirillum halopraeferens]
MVLPPSPSRTALIALLLATPLAFVLPVSADPILGGKPHTVEDRYRPEVSEFRVETLASGLEVPWDLVFLPDGRALVSERAGRIRLMERDGTVRAAPFATLDVHPGGEGGLMGIALHPDFPERPWLYAMHTALSGGEPVNRVVRLEAGADSATLDRVVLDGIPASRTHNGGRIAFGPDGMLYIGTGDATRPRLAQDRASLAGKILRITADGGIPADNPFRNSPVWSLGHRNVQGLAWHPRTGDLFATDHGPNGEFGLSAHDEVNVIRAGGNYGWPLAVGAAGVEPFIDPLTVWPDTPVPPAAIVFHGEDAYIATLESEALIHLDLEMDGGYRVRGIDRLFANGPRSGAYGRLRLAVRGPDGALYIGTGNHDGRGIPSRADDRILRLSPVAQAERS